MKEKNKKTISILGCGWLGLPLATQLVECGWEVKGSTTTLDKQQLLQEKRIIPYLLNVDDLENGEHDFFQSDILFLNIPFRRSFSNPYIYKDQVNKVMVCVKKSSIKKVIFASSTSVYPRYGGCVNEDGDIEPENERARVLLSIEEDVMSSTCFESTVIRFSGLYGGTRCIGNFLSGKKNIKDPQQLVNLIHLDDCLGIIQGIIYQNLWGEIFNACSDEHPLRCALYTEAAKFLGVLPPDFTSIDTDESKNYKIVSNQKIVDRLNYTFLHPDPMKMESY